MKQQAELALADLPVARSPLRLVASRGARVAELVLPAPAPASPPAIRTLFPAVHHVQADRSALGRDGRGSHLLARRDRDEGHTLRRRATRPPGLRPCEC